MLILIWGVWYVDKTAPIRSIQGVVKKTYVASERSGTKFVTAVEIEDGEIIEINPPKKQWHKLEVGDRGTLYRRDGMETKYTFVTEGELPPTNEAELMLPSILSGAVIFACLLLGLLDYLETRSIRNLIQRNSPPADNPPPEMNIPPPGLEENSTLLNEGIDEIDEVDEPLNEKIRKRDLID